MSVKPDDQQRLNHLKISLLAIGLTWNKDYRLVNRRPKWRVNFMRPVTDEQFYRATQLVDTIMNMR
jgi:hypothetical protein